MRVSSLLFLVWFPLLCCGWAQLTPSETRILLQLQHILEYPSVLQGWTNWTNFCYLPPSDSLSIVCSHHHVTELTVIGNTNRPTLSESFSIDSFFTLLTKLSNLQVLSLVSLGLWGSLPSKVNRFYSLRVLNMSSNSIHGAIPPELGLMTSLGSLVLAHNLLNGSVPDLTNLARLQDLDLSDNRLGPGFPSLGSNIVRVVLRNNAFRSSLPSKLEGFYHLQHLDVSWNKFIGPISSEWFRLPSLRYLNMARNKLSGTLSTNHSCSDGLEFVDVSYNYLIGKLPLCTTGSTKRVMIYTWNCLSLKNQHPYSFCHKEALAVRPTRADKRHRRISKLAVILTVVGGIIAVAGTIIALVYTRAKTQKSEIYTVERSVSRKASAQLSPKLPTEARHVWPSLRYGLRTYRVFSMDEIDVATNSFSPSNLMEGHLKQIYKGCLRDGSSVVVRCIKLNQRHSLERLSQHMEVLSNLRHQHLVSLLGHCILTPQDYPNAANTIILVFQYVSGSTLRTHLTDTLKWPQRTAITLGIAKGIQFLHTGITPGIYGNDVRIDNILLDQNLTPKISNYNLLIPSGPNAGSQSPITGAETPASLGSCKHSSDEDGEREDVYQLGAILLEVITGKPITCQSELEALRLQLEQSIANIPQTLKGMADSSIRATYAYESLRTTAEITVKCLSKDPVVRPTIEDVIWNLQYSVQVQDGWTISENLTAKLETTG